MSEELSQQEMADLAASQDMNPKNKLASTEATKTAPIAAAKDLQDFFNSNNDKFTEIFRYVSSQAHIVEAEASEELKHLRDLIKIHVGLTRVAAGKIP